LEFACEADLRLNRDYACSTRKHLSRVRSPVRTDVEGQIPELEVRGVETELADFPGIGVSKPNEPRALKRYPTPRCRPQLADPNPHCAPF
jgi:hypothetical protein